MLTIPYLSYISSYQIINRGERILLASFFSIMLLICNNLMSYKVLLYCGFVLLSGCQLLPDSAAREDDDNDGVINLFDVDDDGDGLIEIDSIKGLNSMRLVPDGSGYKPSPVDVTNKKGCGNGASRDECEGYELVADLDLKYVRDWNSIGHNFFYDDRLQIGKPFTSILDGNGHSIRNMRFREPLFHSRNHGFFAHTKGATIRNLYLHNVDLFAGKAGGAVIGLAEYTRLESVAVIDSSIEGKTASGGLIGKGDNVRIISSYVGGSTIESEENSGALIGDAGQTVIIASYATRNKLKALNRLGGLVGRGRGLTISSSYSLAQRMDSWVLMGGLVGSMQGGAIQFSYAANDYDGIEAGGLAGEWNNGSVAISSYWDLDTGKDNGYGQGISLADLARPIDFSEYYADWLDGEPQTIWCDSNHNGRIEEEEKVEENRIWDFGDSSQYPRIRCGLKQPDN